MGLLAAVNEGSGGAGGQLVTLGGGCATPLFGELDDGTTTKTVVLDQHPATPTQPRRIQVVYAYQPVQCPYVCSLAALER